MSGGSVQPALHIRDELLGPKRTSGPLMAAELPDLLRGVFAKRKPFQSLTRVIRAMGPSDSSASPTQEFGMVSPEFKRCAS